MPGLDTSAPLLFEAARSICAVRKSDATAATKHQAKRVLLDTLGVGIGGSKTALGRVGIKAISREFAPGKCLLWGSQTKLRAQGAVLLNALAASATDFTEGSRAAAGHPAEAVVPTALALGRETGATIEDLLTAIVVGYEIGTRFSLARDRSQIQTYATGRWRAFAAAACSVKLLGLDVEETMHALSLAAVISPAMLAGHVDVSSGSMAKEGTPWAAQTGLQSAVLAKRGFRGPYTFLDQGQDYDPSAVVSGWGERWHIDGNYFKPYACCRWIHPAIDAGLEIRRQHGLPFERIRDVEVETFGRILDLARTEQPLNSTQAQFHPPFCLAGALYHGQLLPRHLSERSLANRRIRSLASRIRLRVNKEFDRSFPDRLSCRVIIRAGDETISSPLHTQPRWGPESPASDEELLEKFVRLAGERGRRIWVSVMQDRIRTVRDLEERLAGGP
jgi:2-methylcitrate dehydratase PrpD